MCTSVAPNWPGVCGVDEDAVTCPETVRVPSLKTCTVDGG